VAAEIQKEVEDKIAVVEDKKPKTEGGTEVNEEFKQPSAFSHIFLVAFFLCFLSLSLIAG